MKRKIVFLTGAGVSAESGISTFRDADGLWEKYPVMQVCSVNGFRADPALVHRFYNERRRQLLEVSPNSAHKAIAALQDRYDVTVVTQNVDDLHERGGMDPARVIHLHGELMKVRAIDATPRCSPCAPTGASQPPKPSSTATTSDRTSSFSRKPYQTLSRPPK